MTPRAPAVDTSELLYPDSQRATARTRCVSTPYVLDQYSIAPCTERRGVVAREPARQAHAAGAQSLRVVRGPTIASGVSLARRWKLRTAAAVLEPKLPSSRPTRSPWRR